MPDRLSDPVPSRLPPDGGETFAVTPEARHWSEMQPSTNDDPPPETYAVGEEVDSPYPVEAKSWREIVANQSSGNELYAVGPAADELPHRHAIVAAIAGDAARHMKKFDDQRVATARDPRRFTLGRLLFVFTLAAVVFGLGARLPRPVFAGVAGLAALVTACGSRWLLGESAWAQLAWWTLMLVYLSTSLFALVGI